MISHDILMNKENPYEGLASAIVCQAAEDYRTVCQVLKIKPDDHDYLKEKKKLLKFFNSQWYTYLTKMDPIALLEGLNKELE